MTNFDFLLGIGKFSSFAGAACAAEKIFGIDTAACAVNARRAAELAVKWMYENDQALPEPDRDQLAALTGAPEFRRLVGAKMLESLDFIRRVGNNAAHNPDSVTKQQAEYALRNLYAFCRYLTRRYGGKTVEDAYDTSLLDPEAELVTEAFDQGDIRRLLAENRAMKRLLRERNADVTTETSPSPKLSEADTRRLRIEADLAYAGWRAGEGLSVEYPIEGLPGGSGVGYADYVLCDKQGVPLAILETQASGRSLAIGRQQAKLYADCLEKRFSRRPVIFLSNGTETRIWRDSVEAERSLRGFYSREDLLRTAGVLAESRPVTEADIDACRPDRPYQAEALHAILDALCTKRERLAFLSMAPGTGKTRVAAATVSALRRCGRVKNVLYLSGSDVSAEQALREFRSCGASQNPATLRDKRDIHDADMLFSTFAELLAEADDTVARGGTHFFTAGRFDLVICDETDGDTVAHYRDVLTAFDAPLLAMTAAPAEEMDPALASLVGAAELRAVYCYPHARAVEDGYLAARSGVSLTLSHLSQGIREKDLQGAEKERYRALFRDAGLPIPASIRPSEMFCEYYCPDTVRTALLYLREHGISHGGVLGKTVIFTENHFHSEMIYDEWGRLFPTDAPHTCRVIDGETNYVRTLIDDFTDTAKMPRVAVSHDLLLDGVDMPAVENLVFFTRAPSRSLYWRMLGRGMRRCDALPQRKPRFFVLDLRGNFEIWEGDTASAEDALPVWNRLFRVRLDLLSELGERAGENQLQTLHTSLAKTLRGQIASLRRDSFRSRGYGDMLTRLADAKALSACTPTDMAWLRVHIAPLILPDSTAAVALWDLQFCTLLLARLRRGETAETEADILRTVARLSAQKGWAEIARHKKLLNRILQSGYLRTADIPSLDGIRRTLAPLVGKLPAPRPRLIRIADRILGESEPESGTCPKHPTSK